MRLGAADQAGEGVDITRVIKKLILHDLVECAGDNPIFWQLRCADMEPRNSLPLTGYLAFFPTEIYATIFVPHGKEFEANNDPQPLCKSLTRFPAPHAKPLLQAVPAFVEYNVTSPFVERSL